MSITLCKKRNSTFHNEDLHELNDVLSAIDDLPTELLIYKDICSICIRAFDLVHSA